MYITSLDERVLGVTPVCGGAARKVGAPQIEKGWGFNVSSIPFTWGLMEPSSPTKNPDGSWSHNWNQSYLDSLDNTIQQMTTKNIYIILKLKPAWSQFSDSGSCSGGGMPPWLYPGINLAASIDQLRCDFYVKPDVIVSGAP